MPGQNVRGFVERVALVTGGARGVGRAVALQLALEGVYVIVSYAPGDAEGARVAGELREMGTLAHAFAADVTRGEGVRGLLASVEATFGRLDLLVNASAVRPASHGEEVTEAVWEEVLNVSLKSAFLLTREAARLLRARPAPSVVNVAAEVGLTGEGAPHTVAAHAGLVGLTKSLARELAPRIRVNCVASSDGAGRGARPAPDEVARACVFLLSPAAASITGQTLVVGGGLRGADNSVQAV
ncbi:MAG TPA: SDR family oxidoreductase [Pyrinomonadaceae bacterium]|nr:SDR family oxidoreductase [Pyrinomonadaceae bacterium]